MIFLILPLHNMTSRINSAKVEHGGFEACANTQPDSCEAAKLAAGVLQIRAVVWCILLRECLDCFRLVPVEGVNIREASIRLVYYR